MNSISCATAGNCAAGGTYTRRAVQPLQAFVVDETNGSWGNAIEVPGTATLNSGGGASRELGLVCRGRRLRRRRLLHRRLLATTRAFVVDETNGSWGNAIEVPGTATLNSGGYAEVDSVSCATAGNCAAGGDYIDGAGAEAFVVDETNGSWGNAIEVPGTATSTRRRRRRELGLVCHGRQLRRRRLLHRRRRPPQAFVVDETNGSWGNAIEVPGTAALNSGGDASCARSRVPRPATALPAATTPTAPAITGLRGRRDERQLGQRDRSARHGDPQQRRQRPRELGLVCHGRRLRRRRLLRRRLRRPPGVRGRRDERQLGQRDRGAGHGGPQQRRRRSVESVSCATAGNCAAGGRYSDGPFNRGQAFVANSALPLSLNARGTKCNGPRYGTGNHVIVPAGDTCTLASGTHVIGNAIVSKGGTLYATGVKIGAPSRSSAPPSARAASAATSRPSPLEAR